MENERMEKLFGEMLFYLAELIHDEDDLQMTLGAIGFNDEEIRAIVSAV